MDVHIFYVTSVIINRPNSIISNSKIHKRTINRPNKYNVYTRQCNFIKKIGHEITKTIITKNKNQTGIKRK